CFFLQDKLGVDALTAFKRWTLQSATVDGAAWSQPNSKRVKGCLSAAPTHIIMSMGTYKGVSPSNMDSNLKAYEMLLTYSDAAKNCRTTEQNKKRGHVVAAARYVSGRHDSIHS
ncbi:hypothetical protein EG68_01576, partial [Paragonimus skrjabini miyazakii]